MNFWCVGRNYADHAKELGNEIPEEPIVFLKSGGTVISNSVSNSVSSSVLNSVSSSEINLPNWAQEIHHEIEIAFQFDGNFKFSNVALALDLTERKVQRESKTKGLPWTKAKSFRGSCPLGTTKPIVFETLILESQDWELQLWVNGQLRQSGKISQMLFSPQVLSKYILKIYPVEPGDWLLTGTPAGVGPLIKGDQLEGKWGPLLNQHWHVH